MRCETTQGTYSCKCVVRFSTTNNIALSKNDLRWYVQTVCADTPRLSAKCLVSPVTFIKEFRSLQCRACGSSPRTRATVKTTNGKSRWIHSRSLCEPRRAATACSKIVRSTARHLAPMQHQLLHSLDTVQYAVRPRDQSVPEFIASRSYISFIVGERAVSPKERHSLTKEEHNEVGTLSHACRPERKWTCTSDCGSTARCPHMSTYVHICLHM